VIGREPCRGTEPADIDAAGTGVLPKSAREIRELKRKNAELERTIEAATSFFVREATRNAGDLLIHRRAQGPVRGRTDLPGADAHGMPIARQTYCARVCRPPSKRG
jgi:hypothetical protein